jgi:hypothetical protein
MRELQNMNAEAVSSGSTSGSWSPAWMSLEVVRPDPSTRSVVFASLLGGGLGALAAATMFPALPALMFGAAIGAYSGFLATAMEALGSGDLPD